MKRTLIAAALVILALPASAQLNGEWMQPNLATGCVPVGLDIEVLGDAEGDENLQRVLRNATESRLRSARLYADDGWDNHRQSLDLHLTILGPVSKYDAYLYRFIWDTGYGQAGTVLVWAMGSIGVHGDESHHHTSISSIVDAFIIEYLRTNPECA